MYSYAIVHRPSDPERFSESVPYVLAVVELDNGCRIVSNIVGYEPEDVEIEQEVTVVFDTRSADYAVPMFEPKH